MEGFEQEMFDRWQGFCERVGPQNLELEYSLLSDRYTSEARGYHNLLHISEALSDFDEVRDLVNSPNELEAAIWYHDVVYDPLSPNNEWWSAAFMEESLYAVGASESFVSLASSLVMATKDHTPETEDEKYMVDIDFGILGKKWQRFLDYEFGIRHEYSMFGDEVYYPKRKEVLQGFLDRDNLYHTEYFKEKYDSQARRNLEILLGMI